MIKNLLLIGCGKMGGALLKGFAQKFVTTQFYVIDPHLKSKPLFADYINIHFFQDLDHLPKTLTPDIILFAVKPQISDDVLKKAASYEKFTERATAISVMAGKTLETLKSYFHPKLPFVRVMPNTPSSVLAGVSLAIGEGIDQPQKQQVHNLLQSVGEVYWLAHENQIDALTTLSGCGPAYLFLFIEVLTKACLKLGLEDKALIQKIAIQTLYGSAKLALNSEESPEILRKNVTSPKGMTEVALNVLIEKEGLQMLFDQALQKAYNRAKELARI
jgi:pyrroline-5-carboxylate reductase